MTCRLTRLRLSAWLAAFLLTCAGSAHAADDSCRQLFKIRSANSATPTTVTFVNASNAQRGILWLGFDGQPKDYGNLAPGESRSINTFLTHPWMITTGPGDCLEILMPRPGGSVIRLAATAQETRVRSPGGGSDSAAGEEGGRARGCPPGTVPKPETDDCVQAPAGASFAGNPVGGRSLGGIMRRAPSQQSGRVRSLQEGQSITILRNTGVVTDGYSWFQIRVDGTVGFKWGGILCSEDPMPGIYEVCGANRSSTPARSDPQVDPANTPPVSASGRPAWCNSARLPSEHAICGNPDLARLDDVLNVAYRRATTDSAGKRTEIDREHRRWRGRRDACANDGKCIERRYREQITLLESYFNN